MSDYEDGTVSLLLGDCLDRMKEIPDGSVDLIAADLPYGTTACKWDAVIPFDPMWAAFRRVLKPRGAVVLTACQPFTSMLTLSNPEWFRYETIWEKHKAIGFLWARKRPNACHENILVFGESWTTYNPQKERGDPYKRGVVAIHDSEANAQSPRIGECYSESKDGTRFPRSVVKIKNADLTENRFHPTQKPVALFEYLIRTYSNEGETVLDCTAGSGTTGVACINTGRRFIGIERDEGYFRIARSRLIAARSAARELLPLGPA